MSQRNNINGQLRGFYYAASGNEIFDGQTVERPKLFIQSAIDEAAVVSPPPSGGNIALVTGSQGGSFIENIVLSNFVQFNGEDTTLTASTGTTVTMATGLRCRLENASNTGSGDTFLIDGLSNSAIFAGRCGGATGLGVNITGTVTNIFVDFASLDVTADGGTGISITSTRTRIGGTPTGANCLWDRCFFFLLLRNSVIMQKGMLGKFLMTSWLKYSLAFRTREP